MMITASGATRCTWGMIFSISESGASDGHPGLSGVLLRPGGDHDDVGSPAELDVVGALDAAHRHELDPVRQVECLCLDLRLVDVVQHDLARDPLDEAGVGEGGAHGTRPDDGQLGGTAFSVAHGVALSVVVAQILPVPACHRRRLASDLRTTAPSRVGQNGGRERSRKLPYPAVAMRESRIATTPRSSPERISRPLPWARTGAWW